MKNFVVDNFSKIKLNADKFCTFNLKNASVTFNKLQNLKVSLQFTIYNFSSGKKKKNKNKNKNKRIKIEILRFNVK